MNFNEHLSEVKELLRAKYPAIDFDNDYPVSNKLSDLVWIITSRLNHPNPVKEERLVNTEQDPEWIKFR